VSSTTQRKGLNLPVSDLAGKTIGLFAHFKEHSPYMLKELSELLREKIPGVKFSPYQYVVDTKELVNDPEHDKEVKEWLKGVDTVIAAYGDAGSCAMFLAYNAAYLEALGKPVVYLVKNDLYTAAQRGAAARFVPNMRFVRANMPDLSYLEVIDEPVIKGIIRPAVESVVDQVITALIAPLTEKEKQAEDVGSPFADARFTGALEELNNLFYKNGWTNGTPIFPPTEEAVAEMLKGVDLPPDHVVGRIPPMLGNATVEKIAINAVMAGCLPIYMPVLISIVKGMLDHKIHLEGWTCSVSAWFPLIVLSGPITKDLNMNKGGAFLSQYYRPAAAIAKTMAYMIMNIGGVRPGLEDMSEVGHESRMGVCIGENDIDSPWPPLHTDFGFQPDDSTVTLFWPQTHQPLNGVTLQDKLKALCSVEVGGWAAGSAYVLSPRFAQVLASAGYSKKDIRDYVVEYARRPASQVNVRWIAGNNHLPPGTPLPTDPEQSVKKFWNDDHIFIAVGGSNYNGSGVAFQGGGDHGGPSCTKIDLPKNWNVLVEKYNDIVPNYINY
jgi:hypothetical protein